mmetsp:Transcript_78883/g.210705  ORF Transcript_78883/g.210705 Transcript_78883/m.210705 type:complete len:301 (-) Transcript_78883:291-1193(-)
MLDPQRSLSLRHPVLRHLLSHTRQPLLLRCFTAAFALILVVILEDSTGVRRKPKLAVVIIHTLDLWCGRSQYERQPAEMQEIHRRPRRARSLCINQRSDCNHPSRQEWGTDHKSYHQLAFVTCDNHIQMDQNKNCPSKNDDSAPARPHLIERHHTLTNGQVGESVQATAKRNDHTDSGIGHETLPRFAQALKQLDVIASTGQSTLESRFESAAVTMGCHAREPQPLLPTLLIGPTFRRCTDDGFAISNRESDNLDQKLGHELLNHHAGIHGQHHTQQRERHTGCQGNTMETERPMRATTR